MNRSGTTVVIPTYGHARYIGWAVESVLEQTLPADEIIVVNDGSPDETEMCLEPYMDSITYRYQEHAGISQALNTGTDLVKTPYVLYLASDDWLMPHALEVLRDAMRHDTRIGVAHANRRKVDEYMRLLPDGEIPRYGLYRDLSLMLARYSTYTPAILCRTQAIREVGPIPDYPYCQDWWLWISIALKGWHFYGIRDVLGYYRRHSVNSTRATHMTDIAEDEISMLTDWIESGRLNDSLVLVARRAIRHRERILAWYYIRERDRRQALELFTGLSNQEGMSLNTGLGLVAARLPAVLYQTIQRTGLGRRREQKRMQAVLFSEQKGMR